VHQLFQYGGLKPKVEKSLVSMITTNDMTTFSPITLRFLCNSSVNWQKGNTNQLQSLVAETGNNMTWPAKLEVVMARVL
jgi:hypothetical protein